MDKQAIFLWLYLKQFTEMEHADQILFSKMCISCYKLYIEY